MTKCLSSKLHHLLGVESAVFFSRLQVLCAILFLGLRIENIYLVLLNLKFITLAREYCYCYQPV